MRACFVVTLVLAAVIPTAAEVPLLFVDSKPLSFEDTIPGVAPREFIRQTVLITAHDMLGWSTRDATLRESLSERELPRAIQLKVELVGDEKSMTASLHHQGEAIWERRFELARLDDYYPALVEALDAERPALSDVLKKLAPDQEVKAEQQAGDLVEPSLEMNLLKQLVRTRALHRQARQVQSMDAWAALSKSYAHLTLLTQHQWFGSSSVFLARSLLYAQQAQRTAADATQRDQARLNHAYVSAVVGRHGDALRALAKIGLPDAERPDWVDLIELVSTFDTKGLDKFVDDTPAYASLAALLRFYASVSHNEREALRASAQLIAEHAPLVVGVYAECAKSRHSMGLRRWAGATAPQAVNLSLKHAFRGAAKLDSRTMEALRDVEEGEPEDFFSRPGQISAHLIQAEEQDTDTSDLSWQIVGRLLQEDVFVAMVAFIDDARNATKSDLSPYTDACVQYLGGHPYREYIRAWGFDLETERDEFKRSISSLKLIDPRPHMHHLQATLWNLKTEEYPGIGLTAARLGFADHTEYALAERSRHFRGNPEFAKNYQRFFSTISPHSPHLLRCTIFSTPDPTKADLAEWEQQAGSDVEAWDMIYERLTKFGLPEDRLRVLTKRMELAPNAGTAFELAKHHANAGDKKAYFKTLEEFLKDQPGTMENAGLANLLAGRYMALGKLKEAEPHVQMAAQTYSAWGLQTASRYFEHLGELEASEYYAAEHSRSYGGESRTKWYFWCKRQGMGDVDAATELAKTFLESDNAKSHSSGWKAKGVHHQIEGELQAALEAMQAAHKLNADYWTEMQVALLAHYLGDQKSQLWALSALKVRSGGRPNDKILEALVDLVQLDEEADHKTAYEEVDKYLDPDHWDVKCDVAYFAAECALILGDTERARSYYEQCLQSEVERLTPTLASIRLAEMEE